jgi:hypothetical protein
MTIPNTQCIYCTRFQPGNPQGPTCTAFPSGIPEPIIQNEFDHRQPHPDDNGMQFDAVDGWTHPLADEGDE